MMGAGVASIADALVEAHRTGRPFRADPEAGPRSAAEAYRVQQRVLDRLAFGVRPNAWKVSPPGPDGELRASPVPPRLERSPASIAVGARRVLGIEAEIAFRFAAPPPPAATLDDVRAAVDEIIVLLELCETRLDERASPLWKLADFQSHGAFVLGSGTRELQRDFHAQRVELDVEGRAGVCAVGSHPTGRLWEMVVWAVHHSAGRGMPLQAGDVVTTGSWTGLTPLARGEEAVVRFPGIGEARLALG